MNGKLIKKIYLLKNAKKTCELNNRDLNRSWIIFMAVIVTFLLPCSIIGGAWNCMRKKGGIDKSRFEIFRLFFFEEGLTVDFCCWEDTLSKSWNNHFPKSNCFHRNRLSYPFLFALLKERSCVLLIILTTRYYVSFSI